MTWVPLVVAAAVAVAIRALRSRGKTRRSATAAGTGTPDATGEPPSTRTAARARRRAGTRVRGPVALVAQREIRQRARSRLFQVGTLVIVAVIVIAIVVPVLRKGTQPHERVGVVGQLSGPLRTTVVAVGTAVGVQVALVAQPSEAAADADLKAGRVQLLIVDARKLVVNRAFSATDTSRSALLARTIASAVAVQAGLEASGIGAEQSAQLAHAPPLPITGLQPSKASRGTRTATAVYGLILMFVLLTQYGTWILLGVVEEKSSRVVEVLLSTVRPAQLLAGKVLGIGTMAIAQSAVLVATALGLAEAVGSDLVRGTTPLVVWSVVAWILLGYAFYCWVYAAAGSLAERQEHVQTLAFPLQLPILFGYIVSITALSSATPSTLVRVLAYLPPTAPFGMTVLVALRAVTWWEFALSAVISLASTVAVAKVAATVYERAVLLTGRRIHIRDVLAHA